MILTEKVAGDALSLPVDLRVELIDILVKSINVPTKPEIDELWAHEAEMRIDQVDHRAVETVNGEAVFRIIRKWLGK